MQIQYLEYLLELERTGSINRTAANVFMSQQGLSKILNSVEAELGTSIIERSHSGVRFTKAGRLFLAHARKIVDEYNTAYTQLAENLPPQEQPLNVNVATYIVIVLMNRIVNLLDSDIATNYSEMSNSMIGEALMQNDSHDLFVFDWVGNDPFGRRGAPTGTYTIGTFFTTPLGVAVDGINAPKTITREEVLERPIVSYGRTDYRRMLKLVLGEEKQARIATRISDSNLMYGALHTIDSSCAVLDELAFKAGTKEGTSAAFVPFDPPIHLTIGYAYDPKSPYALQYRHFINSLKKALGEIGLGKS